MGFFDLNIPYHETSSSSKPTTSNPTQKQTRIKLAIKAMELGYTGVAYNRTIKGVMSDADCCSISLLSLSSLLKLAPCLSSSVKLHRDLLGLPTSSPFRQYTRLTALVDSAAQATALNSGNPILKSYDFVAVRPLNQSAFEQACQVSEVDIIAIDFSEKLPFRLKLPMVKAAIQRGVYFEVTYSNLIADVQRRRQIISSAKLLVDWTRGKNLIFTSAAPSVNELRGPYDVANLFSLLGLSMERAKAAISKNCRTLIANSLRKKRFYKEAIRIEVISPGKCDSKELCSGDWLKWDPISSGEGDLLLDDMANSFSASNKVSKTVKAIDFASIVDGTPSHGLQVNGLKSGSQAVLQSPDIGKNFVCAAEMIDVVVATNCVSEQPETNHISLKNTPSINQTSTCEDSRQSFSPNSSPKFLTNTEDIRTHATTTEEVPKNSNGLDVHFAPVEIAIRDLQLQNCISSCEPAVVLPDEDASFHTIVRDMEFDAACSADAFTPSLNDSAFQNEESERSTSFDVVLGAHNVAMDKGLTEMDINNQADLSFDSSNMSLHNFVLEREQIREPRDDEVLLAEAKPFVESYDARKGEDDSSIVYHDQVKEVIMEEPKQGEDHTEINYPAKDETISVVDHEQLEEVTMEEQMQGEDHTEINYPTLDETISGKSRPKQRAPHGVFLFPFKRWLNPIPLKKKARKFKSKIKTV